MKQHSSNSYQRRVINVAPEHICRDQVWTWYPHQALSIQNQHAAAKKILMVGNKADNFQNLFWENVTNTFSINETTTAPKQGKVGRRGFRATRIIAKIWRSTSFKSKYFKQSRYYYNLVFKLFSYWPELWFVKTWAL